MALASAPSTPEKGQCVPMIRRSFTAPIKTAGQTVRALDVQAQGAETLYDHSTCRIVSFSTISTSSKRHSSVSDGRFELREESAGTLPWATRTERTIAAGALRIYRVLGSVAFLNSGSILHPILAKSQCWCVDGMSKFILRIRPNSYYRIELPCQTDEDMIKVEEFKVIIEKVLQYEKTPCPFKRGFTVDLPEPPIEPVLKKPWTRRYQQEASNTEENISTHEVCAESKEDEAGGTIPEDLLQECTEPFVFYRSPKKVREYPTDMSENAGIFNGEEERNTPDTQHANAESFMQTVTMEPRRMKTLTRMKRIVAARTVTAPPQLSLQFSPPSTSREASMLSQASSVDSFYSFTSSIDDQPHSPPIANDFDSVLDRISAQQQPYVDHHLCDDESITTIDTSHYNPSWADLESLPGDDDDATITISNCPHTPALTHDGLSQDDEIDNETLQTPSPPGLRVRQSVLKRYRFRTSFLPSSSIVVPVPRISPIPSTHHLTTALLQRTYSLFFGPPLHLVALMLRIATRIIRSALHNPYASSSKNGDRIPGGWETSDGSETDVYELVERNAIAGAVTLPNEQKGANRTDASDDDTLDEGDDYGYSLSASTSSSISKWEVKGRWGCGFD